MSDMAELYFKKINMKNLILFILFSIISIIGTNAQPLGSINIDQLSDQQLLQYMNSAGLSGLNESQLESKAKSKGLNNDQISKIKSRVSNLQTSQSVKTNSAPPVNVDRVLVPVITPQINYTENGVFGSELFTNTNLTFEPNLRIPTPVNYVLGVDDELVIDIFGYSENTYKLKVQPEGYIRMPNIGPVRVVGLPIEDARKKIKQQLQKIYPGILSGNTSVQISLGQIRTIRVTLIGEVIRPGTYSIPSLANIANALYVSGGPNANGSFRTIELIRNGKTKVIFDLYDFLIKGDLSNNLMLQDDDIIKINPYKIRVSVYGAVKKSAVFEAKENENLGSIITYANGFSDNVYKESFKVIRLGKTEKEILTIPFQEYLNFKIQSGDVIVLDNIIDRFKNRVSINGAVFHPGDYSTDNVTNLKQLILKAGLKEDAYRNRAIITRLQTDFTPTIINFNLNDILSEKQQITLQREDIVTITSVFSIREKYTVSINGEVGNSGSYDYRDSMKLKDLILLAGGFKESASGKKIEISRRIRNLNKPESDTNLYAIINTVEMDKELNSNNNSEFVLQPFDQVSVRKNPNYKEQIIVTIDGEVMYPGQYSLLKNNEKISDLIKRAGGLKSNAYLEGAVLLRNTFQNYSERLLVENKIETIKSQSKDSLTKELVTSKLSDPQKLVGIRLKEVLEDENSRYNVILEDGDVLRVPKKIETVQVFGAAVFVSKKVVYRDGLKFMDVIKESGGFTSNAQKKKAYVVYANGEVKTTKKIFIFNKFPKIKPGTEIYVPLKEERKNINSQEILGISSSIVGLAALVFGIINLTK